MPESKTLLNGRFLLQKKLGDGGMAQVFRAFDRRLQVWRAIKILRPEYARRKKLRQRFETEAQAMARLEHPHIVRVYDVGSEGDTAWIIMELCDGGSTEDWVVEHGPMPPGRAVDITLQVVHALQAAHAAGVIHRDVKPQNVLITAEGTCKVTDFGIAQLESTSLTRTGTVMGTLGFMAPEQRSDSKQVDVRADLYSVGATLYNLVTGRIHMDLHAADQDDEILQGVPELLVPVIRTATAYHRDDRYQDAHDIERALRVVRSKLPTDPPSPSLAPKTIERPDPPSMVEQALAEAQAAEADAGTPIPGETILPSADISETILPPSLQDAAHERLEELQRGPATPPPQRRRQPAGSEPSPEPAREPANGSGGSLPWVPHAERHDDDEDFDFESLYVQSNTPAPRQRMDIGVDDSSLAPTRQPTDERPTTSEEPAPEAASTPIGRPEPTDEHDDEHDRTSSMEMLSEAMGEAWAFFLQILNGMFRVITGPLRYAFWPTVALLGIATVASWQGATAVGSAERATESSARALTASMDREAESLIDDLATAGANAPVLEAHYAAYREATTEQARREAASRLARVMEDQLVGLEEAGDEDRIRARQALQTRVQSVTRNRTRMIESRQAWRESATSAAGRMAVLLRLAGKPPEARE